MNTIKSIIFSILTLISFVNVKAVTELKGDSTKEFIEKAPLPVIVFRGGFFGTQKAKKDFEDLEKQYKDTYIFAIGLDWSRPLWDIDFHFIALFNKGKLIGSFPAVQKEEIIRYIQSLQNTGKLPLDYQLIEAIRSYDIKTVKKLLQEGANPNYVLTKDPYYEPKDTLPLLEAYDQTFAPDIRTRTKMIQILLQADADPYLKIKTKEKTTDFYELIVSEVRDTEFGIETLQLVKENLQNILDTLKNKTGFLQNIQNKPRALRIRLKNIF